MKTQTLGDETPRVCGPHWGWLGSQLPEVVTWSYDLHLAHMIPRWKYISK